MEGGYLAMSPRERSRLVMMTRVREKAITIKETAEVMGMSYRQSRRIYKRYRGGGDRGLIHQARGQPSNRGKDCKVDGSIHIAYRDREVLFTEIKELPRKPMVTHQKQQNSQPKRKYVPPPDHPWRRYSLQSQRTSQALPV